MKVKKRNGSMVAVNLSKIQERIKIQARGLHNVDCIEVAKKAVEGLYDGVTTKQLDELAAETAASMAINHPEYSLLGSRICVTSLYKETPDTFSACVNRLYKRTSLIDKDFYEFVMANKDAIDAKIDHSKDLQRDYFGFKTLERAYLLRDRDKVVERPQYMFMRVAIGVSKFDLKSAFKTYKYLSNGDYIHATPTLFNAGTTKPQLSSCFLIDNKGDSLDGIMDTQKDVAKISSASGGIGLSISNIRASGSYIKGSGGTSKGLLPIFKVYNEHARHWDQGGNKRKGSFAMYLEPWHDDFEVFLDIRKNHGKEELRARDLFTAIWMNDLFMERLDKSISTGEPIMWTFFCPNEVYQSKGKKFTDMYGDEFKEFYEGCERDGIGRRSVKVTDLWTKICTAQIETGTPYIVYKDHVNNKSNQKNIGVIKSSNLCVSGDTKITTIFGEEVISDWEGKFISVWNGNEWSEVKVHKTGSNQSLLKMTFSNGSILKCTPYHKFYIKNSSGGESEVRAKNLCVGDKIIDFSKPVHDESLEYLKLANFSGISVTSVVESGRGDTYCFNEPKRHRGVFNGVLTGNCTEIVEYSDENEQAVCNLASIALPKYVSTVGSEKVFDHYRLFEVTYHATRQLNNVIDINHYPTKETSTSNLKHRPIGLGVQGLADVFAMLDLDFDSKEAIRLNEEIFETIYYAALSSSCDLAKENKESLAKEYNKRRESDSSYPELSSIKTAKYLGAYRTFNGSPLSEGKFQFNLWGADDPQGRWDWGKLRESILDYGVTNSLLVAPMPTASTSQILGNNECFEPFNSNIYVRRTLAGEFPVINKHLIRDLEKEGIWNKSMKNKLILGKGSIQGIEEIPARIRSKYKTVYEISQKVVIQMAIDRGKFIDQTQSMNLFLASPTVNKLTGMQMMAWKGGLKTGMYYLRSKAATDAIQFTVDKEESVPVEAAACSIDNPDCDSCGS